MNTPHIPSVQQSMMAQQPSIPPDLLDMLAQMHVRDAQEAAKRNMAMQSQQQMPTVAEALKASVTDNARQDIMQKMGAMQTPQDAINANQQAMPGMTPPPAEGGLKAAAGPMQAMKPPTEQQAYAGGGVIAFAGGGQPPGGGMEQEVAAATQITDPIKKSNAYAALQKKYGVNELLPLIQKYEQGRPGAGLAAASMPDMPQLPPEVANRTRDIEGRLDKVMNTDPAAQAKAAQQRYDEGTGEAFNKYMQAKQSDIDAQQRIYAQHQEATKPGWADWLASFDPNARTFGAGVAPKMLAKQRGYQDAIKENALKMQGLRAATDTDKYNRDITRYGVGEKSYAGAEDKSVEGLKAAAQMHAHTQQTAAAVLTAWEQAKARLQAAKIDAAQRALTASEGRAQREAQREEREIERLYAQAVNIESNARKEAGDKVDALKGQVADPSKLTKMFDEEYAKRLRSSALYTDIMRKLKIEQPVVAPSPTITLTKPLSDK